MSLTIILAFLKSRMSTQPRFLLLIRLDNLIGVTIDNMIPTHKFGGAWTEEKLERIRKYLSAYTTIFTHNPKAAFLETYYVDAFAGTGYRGIETGQQETPQGLFTSSAIDTLTNDAEALKRGSAYIALATEPSFDKYVFMDRRSDFVEALNGLKAEFPSKANKLIVLKGEANETLKGWIRSKNWKKCRAVVFLDPYGMDVDWQTIEEIAETKAIDLWLLFPLAQAVNRLLTRDRLPNDSWSAKLTKFFGSDDWKDAFYHPVQDRQMGLFDTEEDKEITYRKDADFDSIKQYFVERLDTVFARVADNPLSLFNSQNVPLYLLCFASANPRGSATAVKIAQDILGRQT